MCIDPSPPIEKLKRQIKYEKLAVKWWNRNLHSLFYKRITALSKGQLVTATSVKKNLQVYKMQ